MNKTNGKTGQQYGTNENKIEMEKWKINTNDIGSVLNGKRKC